MQLKAPILVFILALVGCKSTGNRSEMLSDGDQYQVVRAFSCNSQKGIGQRSLAFSFASTDNGRKDLYGRKDVVVLSSGEVAFANNSGKTHSFTKDAVLGRKDEGEPFDSRDLLTLGRRLYIGGRAGDDYFYTLEINDAGGDFMFVSLTVDQSFDGRWYGQMVWKKIAGPEKYACKVVDGN